MSEILSLYSHEKLYVVGAFVIVRGCEYLCSCGLGMPQRRGFECHSSTDVTVATWSLRLAWQRDRLGLGQGAPSRMYNTELYCNFCVCSRFVLFIS